MRQTFFISLLYRKVWMTQSFLGHVLSTKLFFRFRFSSASRAHPSHSQEELW